VAGSRRAAWRKVATADMNGIDSPLYSAVVSTATTGSVAGGRHAGNGRASQLCCDGPDIILTLESEPVNYAVSAACPCCRARRFDNLFSTPANCKQIKQSKKISQHIQHIN